MLGRIMEQILLETMLRHVEIRALEYLSYEGRLKELGLLPRERLKATLQQHSNTLRGPTGKMKGISLSVVIRQKVTILNSKMVG